MKKFFNRKFVSELGTVEHIEARRSRPTQL